MKKAKKLVYIALAVAMLAVSAQISIPLPFLVPITLQLFVVIAAGLVLGPNLAAAAVLVYLFAGLVGLPVFAGFGGGLQYVVKPSFGFLVGFVPCAYVSGLVSKSNLSSQNQENKKRTQVVSCFLKLLIPLFVLYAIGTTYQFLILHYYLGYATQAAFASVGASLLIFILVDVIKIVPLACANSAFVALSKRLVRGLDFNG